MKMSNGNQPSVAEIKQQAMQNKDTGVPARQEGEEDSIENVRLYRETVGLNELGVTVPKRLTSWLGKPSDQALVDTEVARMDEWLNSTPGNPKYRDPAQRDPLPIYINGFKCRYCDETFNHITPCRIRPEERDKVTSYRDHLTEEHLAILADEQDPEKLYKETVVNHDHEITAIRAENEELKSDISELKEMMQTIIGKAKKE
jgi:hypothetical protein